MMIGNMGEVATLTDRLATMPDNMLPRLAQQYKADAITLSLILGEKTRRDRVRNSMKAQAAPQPKVNDQVVASMQPQLPEQIGIGALPAPNMQQMADGGIAGYGSEFDFAQRSEPVVRMADGGVARYQYGGLLEDLIYGNITPTERARREALAAEAEANRRTLRPSTYEEERIRNMALVAAEGGNAGRGTAQLADPDPRYGALGVVPTVGTTAAPPAPTGGLSDLAANKQPPAPATAGAPRGPAPLNLQQQYSNILKAQTGEDPAGKERAALQKQMVENAEAAKKDLLEAQAKEGDLYKGREERLTKREQELEKSKENNTGLALLEAGLAIMSTPGHWAQAVGQGARAGVARYSEGIDKLRAAQERLGEARDRMEDLKINRSDMNARELRQANNEVRRAQQDATKLGIDAIMSRDNVNRDTAKSIFAATVQQNTAQMEIASRERIAAASANRNPTLELLQAVQKDPALAQAYQAMHGTKSDLMSQYTDWLKANPTGTIEDFLKTKAVFSTLGGMAARPVTQLPPGAAVAPR